MHNGRDENYFSVSFNTMNVIEVGKVVREQLLAYIWKATTKHNTAFRNARKNSFPFRNRSPDPKSVGSHLTDWAIPTLRHNIQEFQRLEGLEDTFVRSCEICCNEQKKKANKQNLHGVTKRWLLRVS
jgi:hypothetical protein